MLRPSETSLELPSCSALVLFMEDEKYITVCACDFDDRSNLRATVTHLQLRETRIVTWPCKPGVS